MTKSAAARKYSLRSKTSTGGAGEDGGGYNTTLAPPTPIDPMPEYESDTSSEVEEVDCPVYDDGDDAAMSENDEIQNGEEEGCDNYDDDDAAYEGHGYPADGGVGACGCGGACAGAGGCKCSALACCLKGWTGWKVGKTEVAVCVAVAIYVGLAVVFWEFFRGHFGWLESLSITLKHGFPRLSVLDFFGSVLACRAYRSIARFPKHAVETLVACSLIQFGGTLLVGVLVLGQTPSWMSSLTAWPALVVAWWLTFFCPGDFWHCHVMRHELVLFIAGFGRALSAAHAITSWGVDKALTAHFEKATTSAGVAILCGTLAGCGGGILADLLNLEGHSWNLQRTPTAVASPSFSVQRCFGASCLYYILADPHGLLSFDAPYPLSRLGSWSVSHGVGPSAEAAAIVALYVTAIHLMDYFIPHFEDPLCKVFKLFLGCLGVRSMVNPKKPACLKKPCNKPCKTKTH